MAVGRTPNTSGIGLEKTGVELDSRGYIRANERLETSAPGIWAISEAAGSPQFTHVSVTISASCATTSRVAIEALPTASYLTSCLPIRRSPVSD